MDKQKDFEKGWEEYKAKKKQEVEEMAKDMGIAFQLSNTTRFGTIAEMLVKLGYRKIPKNAVVVPGMAGKDFYTVEKAEWDKMVQRTKDIIHEREEKARKETAEKFAERLKQEVIENDGIGLSSGEVMLACACIDEICKEIAEGNNGT